MNRCKDWVEDIKQKAIKDRWAREGITLIVAVSGGSDSMALLYLLVEMSKEIHLNLIVAHANHEFRGAESDSEEELVIKTAAKLKLPCVTSRLGMAKFIAKTKMNSQQASRQKRYQFLYETAFQYGSSFILTAHHADDQAETVLMRLLRGTGLTGLSGISAKSQGNQVELLRPLLRIPKQELLHYCKLNNIPYRMDSSNTDRHYFRNVIRLDVFPLLEQYNPRLKKALCQFAEISETEDHYMQVQAWKSFFKCVYPKEKGFILQLIPFLRLHSALQRRMINLILKCSDSPYQLQDYTRVEKIIHACTQVESTTMRLDLGGGWIFNREYKAAFIGPVSCLDPVHFDYTMNPEDSSIELAQTGARLRMEQLDGAIRGEHHVDKHDIFLDSKDLLFPLHVRSRKPGDRMQLLGLNGTKKVQDIFVDEKVPQAQRNSIPILLDNKQRILWIPGIRRSTHALVQNHTHQTIRISYEPK